jgi:hypothetical protein
MVMQRLMTVYIFSNIEIYCIVQDYEKVVSLFGFFPCIIVVGSNGLLREWSHYGIYSVRDGEWFRASFVKN